MTTNIMKQLSAKSSIFGWMDILISRKRQAGKDATADLYRATRNWLWKYSNGRDIPVRQVSPPVVDSFVCYLRGLNSLRANTINSYLSGFRAMYNQIICEIGYRPRFLPFGHVVIRLEKTVKRAVRLDVLENVTKLDLQHEPDLKLAADLCAFSFMACGIPFVDLAHLTHENIEGNMLIYHRTKTRTLICMELTQGMRFLLDKYASNGSPYLFPILSEKKVGYERYKALLRKYNNNLKELGRRLGITVPLTSYVIRHTWATEAHRHLIPIALISQALGHTSEKTTHYYVAQLDQSELSKANAIITKTIDQLILRREYP